MARDAGSRSRKRKHDEAATVAPDDSGSVLFVAENPESRSAERKIPTTDAAAFTMQRVDELNDVCALRNINPYNATQPRTPYFHPSCEPLEKLLTSTVKRVCDSYQEHSPSGHRNQNEQSGFTSLLRYRTIKYEASEPIGVFGRADSAKSGTISATFDQPGIAYSGQDDDRGTNLTHEYKSHMSRDVATGKVFGEHNGNEVIETFRPAYRAVAVYHTEAHIKAKVAQLCMDIFEYLEDEDEEAETEDGIKLEHWEPTSTRISNQEGAQKYNSAIAYLITMICSERGYRTKEEMDDTFRKQHKMRKDQLLVDQCLPYSLDDEVYTRLVNTLMAFILELLQTRIEEQDADTLDELQLVCKQMSKPDTSQAHFWRAIEKLNIHVDNPLTELGAVIGDTPGTGDTDQNVKDGTFQYLKSAGYLLLCHPISRAANDEALTRHAMSLVVDLRKTRKAVLVLTKIDLKKPKRTAEEDEKLVLAPEDVTLIHSAEQGMDTLITKQHTLTEHRQRLASERETLQVAQNKLMKNLGTNDEKLFDQLQMNSCRMTNLEGELKASQDEFEQMPSQINEAQSLITRLRIEARNKVDQATVLASCEATKKKLQGAIRDVTKNYMGRSRDPDLHIICTSAQQYGLHLPGSKDSGDRFLDKEATGIPELQRLVAAIVTEKNFATLKAVSTEYVPRLIRNLMVEVSPTHLPTNTLEEVRNSIQYNMDKQIGGIKDDVSLRISNAYARHINALFKDKDTVREWMKGAERLAFRLPGENHASTFKAFCGRKGNWSVNGKKYFWNRSIIDIYSDAARLACEAFQNECEDVQSEISHKVKELFDQLRKSLANGEFKDVDGHDEFLTTVQEAQTGVLSKIEPFWDEQLDILRNIQQDLLRDSEEPGIRQSYVARALLPACKKAYSIQPHFDYFPERDRRKRSRLAHNARRQTIKRSILGTAPSAAKTGRLNVFERIAKILDGDFRRMRIEILQSLETLLISGVQDRLLEDFNHQYKVAPLSTELGAKANMELLATLKEAARTLQDEVKTKVAECEEWKRAGNGVF